MFYVPCLLRKMGNTCHRIEDVDFDGLWQVEKSSELLRMLRLKTSRAKLMEF